MWVHYVETRAAYGIAEAGETWSASGPFSGCQIVVGSTDGRVFVAHLAQQSGSTADTDWSGRGWKGDVWGRWKVPVPSYDFYSNSVVFVDWSKGASPKGIRSSQRVAKKSGAISSRQAANPTQTSISPARLVEPESQVSST